MKFEVTSTTTVTRKYHVEAPDKNAVMDLWIDDPSAVLNWECVDVDESEEEVEPGGIKEVRR